MERVRDLLVVSSADAWVDPAVQVHAVGCAHAERRVDEGWDVTRVEDAADARQVADGHARRVHASHVTWCDCTLEGASQ